MITHFYPHPSFKPPYPSIIWCEGKYNIQHTEFRMGIFSYVTDRSGPEDLITLMVLSYVFPR